MSIRVRAAAVAAATMIAALAPLLGASPRPATPARAADTRAAAASMPVREWRRRHESEILHEFARLLAIPDVAADSANLRRNADTLIAMLERRGLRARRLESPGSPPAILGELATPGAART
ncbi:MAG: hypothetical protein HY076_02145, partial [Candidatus Eisenbacteria bacterium]|nr:hypothetical protein [Candidatus Eisenbacteria bacterium]